MKSIVRWLTVALFALSSTGGYGQQPLPVRYGSEPLKAASVWEWEQVHRPQILQFFTHEVYGRMPERQIPIRYELLAEKSDALGGKAIRREVAIHLEGLANPLLVLIYLPVDVKEPVPAFVGLNFKGNHQVDADESILPSPNSPTEGAALKKDPPRGAAVSRWPIELIIEQGYALVTMAREDIDPDFDDGFQNGIHPLFYEHGQERPRADEWGTIGAWAWGLSRVMDYIERVPEIDAAKVAVVGHSRLGKTALWAGATDRRFALVVSNNSGCTGAALAVCKKRETVAQINKRFPYWFCDNYKRYSDNEGALFVDQQGLIALIAPRPVYVASASLDRYADVEGEFLAARYATPIYELYGLKGVYGDLPAVDTPIGEGAVGYHMRAGNHDITRYDWEQFIRFADRHLRQK